jgi:hypothetical protein
MKTILEESMNSHILTSQITRSDWLDGALPVGKAPTDANKADIKAIVEIEANDTIFVKKSPDANWASERV